jgi:flagellar assembly protein FliH
MRTDLARHLQALGFSYQEARMHVLKAIEPLLIEIVARLLPDLARETLAPVVLEALMPMAEAMADTPVTLVMNPAARPAIEQLLERATGLPLVLQEEPTLGEGQVYLRLGTSETQIDLDRAIADITAAVRGFFDLPQRGD